MAYVICWTCNGNGIVNVVKRFGPWGTATCPDCGGTGKDKAKTELMLKMREYRSIMCQRRNRKLDKKEEQQNENVRSNRIR